jgi:hypothetical protein
MLVVGNFQTFTAHGRSDHWSSNGEGLENSQPCATADAQRNNGDTRLTVVGFDIGHIGVHRDPRWVMQLPDFRRRRVAYNQKTGPRLGSLD